MDIIVVLLLCPDCSVGLVVVVGDFWHLPIVAHKRMIYRSVRIGAVGGDLEKKEEDPTMTTFTQSQVDAMVQSALAAAVAQHNSNGRKSRPELQVQWIATATGWRGNYVIELNRADMNNTLAGNHRNPAGKVTGSTEGGTNGWIAISTPAGFPDNIKLSAQVGILVKQVAAEKITPIGVV